MTPRKWGGRVAARLVRLTLDAYGTTCHLCGAGGANSADHIIPRSRGGADTLANLRPAHLRCNKQRGDMPLAEWFATRTLPPSRPWFLSAPPTERADLRPLTSQPDNQGVGTETPCATTERVGNATP